MAESHEDKEGLQLYELGYHLVPSLGEDDLALRVADLQKKIASLGGSIHSEGAPQSMVLAYTMRKMRSGRWEKYDSSFFGWTRFYAKPGSMDELKEELAHNEYLVRYLLVKFDEEVLMSAAAAAEQGGEVKTAPKKLERKQDAESGGEVSEQELDKQLEELIK